MMDLGIFIVLCLCCEFSIFEGFILIRCFVWICYRVGPFDRVWVLTSVVTSTVSSFFLGEENFEATRHACGSNVAETQQTKRAQQMCYTGHS